MSARGIARHAARRQWRLVALALGALAAAMALSGWLRRSDQLLYDIMLNLARRPPSAEVLIIAVDDESIHGIGRWPWRRAIHATLVNRLTEAGARAVGLDLLLTEADAFDPASDESLAQAIRASRRVVLPIVQLLSPEGRVAELRAPLPEFAEAAAGLALASASPDADGLLRSIRLRDPGSGGIPHFSLALARLARGASPAQPFPGEPEADGRFLIPFAGGSGHFRRVSYVDALAGSVPAEEFRDRIVLVGVTATGLAGGHVTPLSGPAGPIPGIEIHANIIDALLRPARIAALPDWANAVLAALTAVGLMTFLRRASPRNGLLVSVAIGCATLLLAAGLLRFGSLWHAPSASLAACVLAYPLWAWRRLESAQAALTEELARLGEEPVLPTVTGGALRQGRGDRIERQIRAVRAAAERQREARRFLTELVRRLPVALVVSDLRGRVVLANTVAEDLLWVDTSSEATSTLDAVLRGLEAPELERFAEQITRARAEAPAGPIEAVTREGRSLLVSGSPFVSRTGAYHGSILMAADVTEHQAASRLREQVMRFVSDDLRAPLGSIVAMSRILREPSGEDAQQFDLGNIEELARGALALAEDFSRLVRIESLNPADFASVNLAALCREAAEQTVGAARARGVSVRVAVAPEADAAFVRGDAGVLRGAIASLIERAIRRSPTGTEVEADVRQSGLRWQVAVVDRGPRIDRADLDALLSGEPAPAGRPDDGLRVAVLRAAAQRHGGSIDAASEPETGTRFVLSLPRGQGTAAGAAA